MATVRRPSPAVAASVALHLLLGLGLARVAMHPGSLDWVLARPKADPPQAERVAYVAVAPAPLPPSTAGRAGGDGRPPRAEATRSAAPVVAPTRAPSALPVPARRAPVDADEEGGTGPLVGGGGPLRGVQPRYGDPRVWVPPGEVAAAPKSDKERLDSAFAVRFKQHQDSMAVVAGMRKPGDWTVAREDGTKWGVEPASGSGVSVPRLWLGRISIPLPLALPVRPGQFDRERALGVITRDLAAQAPRRLNEDEFRKAVNQIRARKEWERSRQAIGQQKGGAPESAPKPAEPTAPREE